MDSICLHFRLRISCMQRITAHLWEKKFLSSYFLLSTARLGSVISPSTGGLEIRQGTILNSALNSIDPLNLVHGHQRMTAKQLSKLSIAFTCKPFGSYQNKHTTAESYYLVGIIDQFQLLQFVYLLWIRFSQQNVVVGQNREKW